MLKKLDVDKPDNYQMDTTIGNQLAAAAKMWKKLANIKCWANINSE